MPLSHMLSYFPVVHLLKQSINSFDIKIYTYSSIYFPKADHIILF